MKTLNLVENVPKALEATPDEIVALGLVAPKWLELSRKGACWLARADKHIGHVRVGQWDIHVSSKLPMLNILALADYANFSISDRAEFIDGRNSDEFVSLLADAFVKRTKRVVQRGLLRGYRDQTEDTSTIRGRIDVAASVLNLTRAARAQCTFDEFDFNVAPNQVLAAALLKVSRLSAAARSRPDAQWLLSSMHGVAPFDARPAARRMALNDSRFAHYRLGLSLAELILDDSGLDPARGGTQMSGLIINFAKLFERAVLRAFSEAAPPLGLVTQGNVPLRLADSLPQLEADLVIYRGAKPVSVIDAKYKAGTDPGNYYQLLTYMGLLNVDCGGLVLPQGSRRTPVALVRSWGKDRMVHELVFDIAGDATQLPERFRASAGQILRALLGVKEARAS